MSLKGELFICCMSHYYKANETALLVSRPKADGGGGGGGGGGYRP